MAYERADRKEFIPYTACALKSLTTAIKKLNIIISKNQGPTYCAIVTGMIEEGLKIPLLVKTILGSL